MGKQAANLVTYLKRQRNDVPLRDREPYDAKVQRIQQLGDELDDLVVECAAMTKPNWRAKAEAVVAEITAPPTAPGGETPATSTTLISGRSEGSPVDR